MQQKKEYKVTHLGNVQDVKCSLYFVMEAVIESPAKASENLQWVRDALQEEKEQKNRISVIKMLEALGKRIEKFTIKAP